MELLLAQPLRRSPGRVRTPRRRFVTIPVICLSIWGGTWLGASLVGFIGNPNRTLAVDPWAFVPGLANVALLLFALSGLTMCVLGGGTLSLARARAWR